MPNIINQRIEKGRNIEKQGELRETMTDKRVRIRDKEG